jgi:hypothetical protein
MGCYSWFLCLSRIKNLFPGFPKENGQQEQGSSPAEWRLFYFFWRFSFARPVDPFSHPKDGQPAACKE